MSWVKCLYYTIKLMQYILDYLQCEIVFFIIIIKHVS